MGTLLRFVGLGLLLVVGVLAFFLLEAHWEMRGITPELPGAAAIEDAVSVEGGPVSIRYVNSASQASPGRETIHPSYVVEWPDGRLFLVDAGMDALGAAEFGTTMERFLSAEPIQFHGSVASALGEETSLVRGIAFTHLHIDHTGGILDLCSANSNITVYQTTLQSSSRNYMTAPGQAHIDDSTCPNVQPLPTGFPATFDDFPGLVAVPVGGHTPGSTIFFVKVEDQVWVLSGDIALSLDDLRSNTPKPAIYSALVVPENVARMEELRLWLQELEAEDEFRILVSHDRQSHLGSTLSEYN